MVNLLLFLEHKVKQLKNKSYEFDSETSNFSEKVFVEEFIVEKGGFYLKTKICYRTLKKI